MHEVTVLDVLQARDRRVNMQHKLINVYKKPIISFTMNIAGPKKVSDLIKRAFDAGIEKLEARIPQDKILSFNTNSHNTGYEALLSIDMDSDKLKAICETIENEDCLGRLFDLDVIDTDGTKLSRKELRGCIVCGASGRTCAAGRLHSLDELSLATNKILYDGLLLQDKKRIADLAVKSLIQEVYTTPKPGLVDCNNSGSHNDMNADSFVKSANALHSYFAECFSIGQDTCHLSAKAVFPLLKSAGICAEKAMYCATNGANTHKGVIYSMGIICASIGRLWKPEAPYADIDEITHVCSLISAHAIKSDFKNINDTTAGGFYYCSYGIKGIRGEVLSGFSSVTDFAMPIYIRALENGMNENDAGVFTLINLISYVGDTNLYHRGGLSGAKYAAEYASSLLKNGITAFSLNEVRVMDDEFINRNLSPGGCADLLAVTYFLYAVKKYRDK